MSKKVFIKMNKKQHGVSQAMILVWIILFFASFMPSVEWKWFIGYSIFGFVAYLAFGQYQYVKGNYKDQQG